MGRRFRQVSVWLKHLLSLLRSWFGLRELNGAYPGPSPSASPTGPGATPDASAAEGELGGGSLSCLAASDALRRGEAASDALRRGEAASDALRRGEAASDALRRGEAASVGLRSGAVVAEAPLSGAVAVEALAFASGVVVPAPPPSFGRKRQPVYREPAPRGDEVARGEAPAPPAPAPPGAAPRKPDDDAGVWPEHPGADPIVWLWGEVSATKALSEEWYRRWADPAKPDSLERAWRACTYGEIMVVLLYETDHPAFERASRAAWPLRTYQRRGRAGFRAGGDGFAEAVRAIAGEPPSLSAAIEALRSPKPMCPIGELLLHLQCDGGAALAAWAARWGAGGHEPVLAAWRVARSARSMDRLLEHTGKPGAIGPIREAVRRELGGTLDGHPEHHCADAIRRVVPAPPSLRRVLARRDAIVRSLAGGDP